VRCHSSSKNALQEILGSIAGDDTVMCVARDAEQAEIVAEKLKGILKLC
jgi:transcriptional regulator of arginine metabolism